MEPVLDRIGLLGEPWGCSQQAPCKAWRLNMHPLVLAAHPVDEMERSLSRDPVLSPDCFEGCPTAPIPTQVSDNDRHVPIGARGRGQLPELILELTAISRDENPTNRLAGGVATLARQRDHVGRGPAFDGHSQPEPEPSQYSGQHTE